MITGGTGSFGYQILKELVGYNPKSIRIFSRDEDKQHNLRQELLENPILDKILERYIERNQSVNEIVAAGFSRITVDKIVKMVNNSEYKRRQSPPGVKITTHAFGRERRYPITSKFDK